MKTKLIVSVACLLTATLSNAQSIIDEVFTGSFTSGSLSGKEIFGSIRMNDLGLVNGVALPIPAGPVPNVNGILESISFTFFAPAPLPFLPATQISFDLSDASLSTTTTGTFSGGELFGFSYFRIQGGSSLTAFYDATQSSETAVFFAYNDGLGSISQGTLSLPSNLVAIPEPASAGLFLGLIAASCLVVRRRK